MSDLPIPLQILDKSSRVGGLLKNNNVNPDEFKILVGENRGPLMLDMDVIGHLLISGWVQSGKETILDAIVQSIMLNYEPSEARMILFDTQSDLSQYREPNSYLLTEVLHDLNKLLSAFKWTQGEIDSRYKEMRNHDYRNFYEYNQKAKEKKPRIIFIIKNIEDIILFAHKEAVNLLNTLIEKGRNAGIHLILITNKISKINTPPDLLSQLPNRIICQTTNEEDSIIAGAPGAHTLSTEQFYLLLFQEKPVKFQKILINKLDILNMRHYFKNHFPQVHYSTEVTTVQNSDGGERDTLFNEAVGIIKQHDKVSASLLQRRLSIGYARAARMLDQMEGAGLVGPAEGAMPRKVLKK